MEYDVTVMRPGGRIVDTERLVADDAASAARIVRKRWERVRGMLVDWQFVARKVVADNTGKEWVL